MATNARVMENQQVRESAETPAPEKRSKGPQHLFTRELMGPALRDSIRKLDPRHMMRNPVMFRISTKVGPGKRLTILRKFL